MENSSSSNIYVKPKIARCDIVSAVMQQVQRCPWSPFKMNEIVTLERCLQVASLDDPRVGHILGKLANESVFVEPSRKAKHLIKDDNCKRADKELMRKVHSLMSDITKINKKTDHYLNELEDLLKDRDDINKQIEQLEASILSWEENNNIPDNQFACLLDLLLSSFDRSIEAIRSTIPDFIFSISQSNLVKQLDLMPARYRSCLLTIVKHYNSQQQQQPVNLAQQLNFRQVKLMTQVLKKYMTTLTNLYRDLVTIHRVYSKEVLEELEHIEALRTHLEFLKKPLGDVPRLVEIIHSDFPVNDIFKQLPETIGEPPEEYKDDECSDMMSRLMMKFRSSKNCLKSISFNTSV